MRDRVAKVLKISNKYKYKYTYKQIHKYKNRNTTFCYKNTMYVHWVRHPGSGLCIVRDRVKKVLKMQNKYKYTNTQIQLIAKC